MEKCRKIVTSILADEVDKKVHQHTVAIVETKHANNHHQNLPDGRETFFQNNDTKHSRRRSEHVTTVCLVGARAGQTKHV